PGPRRLHSAGAHTRHRSYHKHGRFNTAIVCHRRLDFKMLSGAAPEILYIYIKGVKGKLASLLGEALGLGQPPTCAEAAKEMGGRILHDSEEVCVAARL
ncbi:MAG: hypothetical protein JZD41_00535, partial [Thermoproteus sp.]|nr:hypothetical protein [Thermoproteus sp.]